MGREICAKKPAADANVNKFADKPLSRLTGDSSPMKGSLSNQASPS